jgi:hypothetical protein
VNVLAAAPVLTDTIPRASIDQILSGLRLIDAEGGRSTFERVRIHLLAASRRKAPNTATAMWTVARDVLSELEKLGLATAGFLPRRLSDIERLRETPCEISTNEFEMARLYAENSGRAYDGFWYDGCPIILTFAD